MELSIRRYPTYKKRPRLAENTFTKNGSAMHHQRNFKHLKIFCFPEEGFSLGLKNKNKIIL